MRDNPPFPESFRAVKVSESFIAYRSTSLLQVNVLLRFTLTLSLPFLFASVSHAHPGHGEVGPTHFLTSPEHLLATTGLIVVACGIAIACRKVRGGRGRAEA
jgi:hypothetical protein